MPLENKKYGVFSVLVGRGAAATEKVCDVNARQSPSQFLKPNWARKYWQLQPDLKSSVGKYFRSSLR